MSEEGNRIMSNEVFGVGPRSSPLGGGQAISVGVVNSSVSGQNESTVERGTGNLMKFSTEVIKDATSGKQGYLSGDTTFTHSWYPEISKILYDVSRSNLSIQDKRVRIMLLIFQWIKKQQCELVDPSVLLSDEDLEVFKNQLEAYKHFLTSEAPIDADLLERSLGDFTGGGKRQRLDGNLQYHYRSSCSRTGGMPSFKDSSVPSNEGGGGPHAAPGARFEFKPDWNFINSVIQDSNFFQYKVPLARQGSSIIARNPNQWIEYNRKVEQNRMALLIGKKDEKGSNNDSQGSSSKDSKDEGDGQQQQPQCPNHLPCNLDRALGEPDSGPGTNSEENLKTDSCRGETEDKNRRDGGPGRVGSSTTDGKEQDPDFGLLLRITKLSGFQQFIRNQIIVSRYTEEMEPPLPQLKFVTARDARKNKALYQARMEGMKRIKLVEDAKRQRRQFITEVLKHSKRFQDAHRENQRSIRRVCSHVLRHSSNKERRDQNMEQQMQRARLNALRAQDEEAYLRLLHEAKNERLLELVHQTEDYMNKLGALVMEHRKQAGSPHVDLDPQLFTEVNSPEQSGPEGSQKPHSCDHCCPRPGGPLTGESGAEAPEDPPAHGACGQAMQTEPCKLCGSKPETCCNRKDGEGDGRSVPLIRAKERYFQVTHMVQEHITKQPECLKGGQLREYQMKGLEWLVSLYNNNLNGILADAMGLGKTVQTVSVLAHIYENKGNRGPHLIIAPLSTLHGNWENEFNRWLPDFVKVIYEGNKEVRKQIRSKYMTGEAKFHVLLTTDAFIMKDKHYLRRFDWEYIIVDEAHRLKNPKSKLVQILNNGFKAKHRLALTGTPLQNDLQEVWALLNYLMPSIFNSSETFQQWFNEPLSSIKSSGRGGGGGGGDNGIVPLDISEEEQLLIVDRLHKVLRPFLLRREKIQVANEVPPKLEEILWCPLSGLQQYLYKELESNENSGPNMLMQLRKVCNHPFLFSTEVQYPSDESIVRVCGKFVMLDSILPKLRAAGHRVLIFSQMTKLLTLLEIFLSLRNMPFLRLDGTTLSEDRQESLKLFNAENSPYFVFLLSTKAGGFGINLQSADTVILFDSDWNPQNDEQAQSRAHRIGQKREVLTLRFVTPDTVEERIMTTAGIKLDKDALIIKSGMYHDLYDGDDLEQKRKEKIQEILRKQRQKEVVNCYYDSDRLNRILARSDRDLEIFERVDRMRKMCHIPGLIMDHTLPPCLFDWKKQAKISRATVENPQKAEELWKICYTRGDPWVVHPKNKSWRKAQTGLEGPDSEKSGGRSSGGDREVLDARDDEALEIDSLVSSTVEERLNFGRKDERTAQGASTRPGTSAVAGKASALESQAPEHVQENITPEEVEYRRESLNDSILLACEMAMKIPEYEAYVALPSQAMFPDYFQIVSKPVCLQHIRQFAKKREFTSLHKLEKYLERLASNAKLYNGVSHFLYHSALHLTNTIMTEVRKRVAVAFYTYKLPKGHIRDHEASQLLDGLNSVSETDLNRKHMLVPDVGEEEEEGEEADGEEDEVEEEGDEDEGKER
ncbi:putative global transcription activator SNF2L2 [Cryptosporidium felis]|nr:putative global transcription activator SNF2L2 [Cryptosporidium felis]